ncbi:MAG: dockerin type I domain-containing protein, partial [Candidatus Colwellbacteria bacterium]|nr:dockerin type I domain-containing protein [Candidatus Colwellbacteria bacterium]
GAAIGVAVTVTIRAEDGLGNLAATYNNTVTLTASGSATGEGIVTIVNGVGTIVLNDTIAETVTLSLSDSAGTGLDISSTKNVTWSSATPPSSTPAPRTIAPTPTLRGRAFPKADITISTFSGSAVLETIRTVSADTGYFNIPLKSTGTTSYGIVASDTTGEKSQAKIFSLNLDIGGINTALNIVVPPTIKLLRGVVTKGDNMIVSGYGFSNSSVRLYIDGKQKGATATTDASGAYRMLLNTADLSFGTHEVMVNETLDDGSVSDYSVRRTIVISQLFTPKADLNGDGKVNIQDWSIFLSRWNTPGGPDKDLDLNGDGLINIADFSIMLRAVQK